MNAQSIIALGIVLPLVAFWFWMFSDFVSHNRTPPNERTIWLIAFVVVGILAAGYYYLAVYREQ